jgi:hypothetical protein
VNSSVRSSRIGRAVAVGLGLAMVGGLSLVSVVPAQAADGDTVIYTSDIASTATPYAGWHVGSSNGAAAFAVAGDQLQVKPGSQIIDGAPADNQRIIGALQYAVSLGQLTLTAGVGDPAFFQIPISFDSGKTTTLSPVVGTANATTTVNLNDNWTTSAAIGADHAAASQDTLGDLLIALNSYSDAAVLGFGVANPGSAVSIVTRAGFMAENFVFAAGTRTVPGTVAISGSPTVGGTLTATTAGWPVGTTFTYVWGIVCPNLGCGDGAGTNSPTYSPVAGDIGYLVSLKVIGTVIGSAPSIEVYAAPTAAVSTPVKPAATAPVANSTGIAAYLSSNSVTEQTQTSTGLPAGSLTPDASHTATLDWGMGDSFVDVYAYSTPTFVGTFPVVNGQAQVVLSAAMLSKLGAGAHTLVVTGQSSGTVQAVSLSVAASLAATGPANPVLPLTAGSLLVLLGAALVFVRRRLLA